MANVSGKRTKKHQRKLEHKQRLMAVAEALLEGPDSVAAVERAEEEDEEMVDAAKAEKKVKAKETKKAKKANLMKE